MDSETYTIRNLIPEAVFRRTTSASHSVLGILAKQLILVDFTCSTLPASSLQIRVSNNLTNMPDLTCMPHTVAVITVACRRSSSVKLEIAIRICNILFKYSDNCSTISTDLYIRVMSVLLVTLTRCDVHWEYVIIIL